MVILKKTAGGNDQLGSSVWKFGDLFFIPPFVGKVEGS